jgi:prevent-host-death family protein
MKASEFKAKCLQVLDEVQATGEPVLVTKRGKVVARLVQAEQPRDETPLERLRRVFPNAGKRNHVSDFDINEGMDEEWRRWEERMELILSPTDDK